jgi:hypothetical protein
MPLVPEKEVTAQGTRRSESKSIVVNGRLEVEDERNHYCVVKAGFGQESSEE